MNNDQCLPHHWIIDEFNVGRCIKCGAVKDFGALMKKYAGTNEVFQVARVRSYSKPGRKRGRPRKETIKL